MADTDYASLIRTEPNAAIMREEIANGIEQAQNDADNAVNTAENANNTVNIVNERVDEIIAHGTDGSLEELVDFRHSNVDNTTYTTIGARGDAIDNKIGNLTSLNTTAKDSTVNAINEVNSQLADNVQQISDLQANKAEKTALDTTNANVELKANIVDLTVERARIDNLVSTTSGSFYQKSTSGTTGALQVVSSGATTGQINLANVTPVATGYTPVVGDYVLLVYGVASGNAELVDSHVGADGKTYTSAGNAIRTQISNLKGYAVERTINLFDVNLVSDGYYVSYTSGNLASNANFCVTDYISIEGSTQYLLRTKNEDNLQIQIAFYDSSKTYISGTQFGSFPTPANAVYARLSFIKSYKDSVMFTKGVFAKSKDYIPYYAIKAYKNSVLTLKDFVSRTLGGDGESVSNQYDTSFTVTLTSKATLLYQRNNSGLVSGDFIFGRFRIVADHDIPLVNVQMIGADGTYYNNIFRNLKANKAYRLFFNSGKFTSSTSTIQYFKITIYGKDSAVTTVVNVDEVCFTTNHYNCWYNEDTKASLPNFNTTRFVAGLNGTYHFCDISAGCEFIKRAIDVLTIPVTLFVQNGTYDIGIDDNMPYAINKGSNLISIIGESRDGVVLQKTCTNTKQGRIIDAGGKCSIENMTLIQNVDGTFTGEYTDSRAYCIHLDSAFDSSEEYKTTAKNLICINYVNAPIGAGLRNNQKLIYDHCNLIYKATTGLNGAFYTHAPSDASATNCSLVVDSCNIQHLADTGRAILIDDVNGSLSYTNIPCTFTRNAIYSQSGVTVTDDFKTTHAIQPISCLNNVAAMNY